MRPQNLKTRIFLDSGDPAETREAIKLLGFLDGQTTNPSLIAKNPETRGRKFTKQEILDFYKKVVREISGLIPEGSVSIEVYADFSTSSKDMLEQAREFNAWISPHPPEYSPLPLPRGERAIERPRALAHIKFPTTTEGLKAAEQAVKEGIRVNMTLVFSQAQAAAVYAATRGAKKGDVFLSPFVGRLDDRGENGMDLISNIIKMYKQGDNHVEVLTASVRSVDHLLQATKLGSDIATAPFKVLKEWADRGMIINNHNYNSNRLKPIFYEETDIGKHWRDYDIRHELTDKGIEKFAADWNVLIR